MRQLRAWMLRLAGFAPSARRERELADELEGHLHMHIDDNIRAGMTPEQARREALLKLGGVESAKEAWRERSSLPFLENLLRDVRFTLRQLRKNPGFTTTAVLMLALGMCASVAIFAFVDATLIAPLPYRNPERLVGLVDKTDSAGVVAFSYPDYLDWKKLNKVFSSLNVYRHANLTLNTASGSEPANSARVSDGLFRTLGVIPVLGRDFYEGESSQGKPRALLLSYASWQRRYGGRREVLGMTATLENVPYTIAGVLPREFQLAPAEPVEFWIAIQPGDGPCGERRTCHSLQSIARLKDGVSVQSAAANVKAIALQLERQYPASNRGYDGGLLTLTETMIGTKIKPVLLVLLGGAALLLVIAGVNVSSLVLVRSESRSREIAVRSALGAAQSRIVRQFVTEGVVLATASSLLGVVLSGWTMQFLAALIPAAMMETMPYLHGVGLNVRVLVFAGAIAVLAAALFSLPPSLRVPRMREGLSEGSRGSAGNTWRRLGSRLVVLELATAVVLLVGAGLLGKSLYRLLRVDIGFEPDRLATLQFSPPRKSYAEIGKATAIEREIVSRMERLPGVKSVAVASQLPVSGYGVNTSIHMLGRPWSGEDNATPYREVSSGYFATLGAKLLRGRYFTDADTVTTPHRAIVNQAFVNRHLPGQDPIGRQFAYNVTGEAIEIVGVVEDIKEGPLDAPRQAIMYVPLQVYPGGYFSLVVRTALVERTMLPAMIGAIREIDPNIPTKEAATMNDSIHASQSAWLHRSSAWLVGGFAAMALLLSVVGLYGVVAYSVSQRTREIGVRTALGADRGSVYRLVLTEAARLTAAGIVSGIALSIAAARLMRGLLFGVESWDFSTLAGVAGVLAAAALVASFVPARRAASVNAVDALRAE
jgi:macrolide transport system ATP-binding/permease protein